MLPIPNSNVSFGQATQMSKNDIDRLNRLYQCCKYWEQSYFSPVFVLNKWADIVKQPYEVKIDTIFSI